MRILPLPDRRYLADGHVRQLEVLFDAILPGTATAPGARDAGAADLVDVLLAVDESEFYEVTAWRRLYETALPALDRVALDRFGRSLADLDTPQATELLGDLAAGRLTGLPDDVDQGQLFATLRAHCIEGCLSDPRWGGNQDRVIWRWLGYAEPPQHFRRTPEGTLQPTGRPPTARRAR
jgi:gluconate 2-dehydrogenase gamma chain